MTLLPRTLYGRLVVILVTGMLAAQVLTSSIWYDVRHSQVLEIPTRLIASRLADIVRVARSDPQHIELFLHNLSTPTFNLELRNAADMQRNPLPLQDQATESLLRSLVDEKTASRTALNLLNLTLLDSQGHKAGVDTLFGSSPAAGQFTLELRLADGRWLHVQATEDQGWTSMAPADVLLDYFLRIYLVRIIVVAIIVLLAVRLAVRPLNQLAQAAQALGQDIRRQPLSIKGPVEVQRAAQAFNLMQQRLLASMAERTRFLMGWMERESQLRAALTAPVESLDDEGALSPAVMDWRGLLACLPEADRAEATQGQDGSPPALAQVWAQGFLAAVDHWADDWAPPRDKEIAEMLADALACIEDLTADDTDQPVLNLYEDDGPPSVSQARFDAFGEALWAVYDLHDIAKSLGPRVAPAVSDKVGRNDPCPCGSGKKYKKCCGA